MDHLTWPVCPKVPKFSSKITPRQPNERFVSSEYAAFSFLKAGFNATAVTTLKARLPPRSTKRSEWPATVPATVVTNKDLLQWLRGFAALEQVLEDYKLVLWGKFLQLKEKGDT